MESICFSYDGIYMFLFDGIYMFLFYGNLYVFHMMESICFYLMESICFYFIWKRTHFPSRDFIQQEVLKFSESSSVGLILFKPQNATAVA